MYTVASDKIKFYPIPLRIREGVIHGTHEVFGSLIKSGDQIVGYMQETAMASKLLTRPASKATQHDCVSSGRNYAATADHAFDIAMSTIEELKVKDLLVGTSCVGISAAEFTVIATKISALEWRIRAHRQSLRSDGLTLELFRLEEVAQGMAILRSIAEQFEFGWSLSNPLSQWSFSANQAHILVERFEGLFNDMIKENPFSISMLELLADAVALASSVQVKSRLAAGQDEAGEDAAGRGSTAFIQMEERLIVDKSLIEAGIAELDYMHDVIEGHRNAAISTLYMIEELRGQNISGQALLAAARAEADTPLIFLPTRCQDA